MLSPRWSLMVLMLVGCGGVVVESNPGDAAPGDDTGKLADTGLGIDVVDELYPVDTALPDTSTADTAIDVGPAPFDAGSDPFTRIKKAIVGKWHGVRTDPWDPVAVVDLAFLPSGLYTAHCSPPSDDECTVWHYGTDADTSIKTYSVFDMHADGTGVSRLNIDIGGRACEGTLDNITFDETLTKLTFDFKPTWIGLGYGPVHFELVRTSW